MKHRFRDWLATQERDSWSDYRAGRSRNLHPFDCGQTRCGCCHSEKLAKAPNPRDVRQSDEARCELTNDERQFEHWLALRRLSARENDLWLEFYDVQRQYGSAELALL